MPASGDSHPFQQTASSVILRRGDSFLVAGVTFLELMVVISILSLFTLLSIPAMRGAHEKNKLRAAAREIAALSRYARSSAVLNEAEAALELDLKEHRCRLNLDAVREQQQGKAPKIGSGASKKKLKQEVEFWRSLPKGVVIKTVFSWDEPDRMTDAARIVFYPDGSASDSQIVLQNMFEKEMTVAINRATGVAEVSLPDVAETPRQPDGD